MDFQQLHDTLIESLSDDEARRLKSLMGELIETEAWKVLAQYLEIDYRSRIAEIAGTPLESQDAALRQEFKKGAATALLVLLQMPQDLIQFCENTLHLTQQQERELKDGWETESV